MMAHDFKAYAVFVSVVQLGSMQAAAVNWGMTASAVSQTIQKLEKQLKIKLLNRTTRQLSLTEAGETFFRHATEMLKQADCAVQALEPLRHEAIGQLNIACVTGLLDSALFDLFGNVLRDHPDLKLNVIFDDDETDLLSQRVDLALRAQDLLRDHFISKHICDFEWAICACADYFVDRAIPQTVQDLVRLDWIDHRNRATRTLTLTRQNERINIQPHFRIACNSVLACRKLTLKGLGVSLQPVEEIVQELRSGALIRLLPEWQLPVTPLYLVMLQRIQSAKVGLASDLIVRYFRERFA